MSFTAQAIRNISFRDSREFVRIFSKFIQNYEFRVQNSHTDSCTNSKQKEKLVCEISEYRARVLKKERNLCTNLNKPTRLHQDRHSKTPSFDNYMVSLKSDNIKIISKFSTYNCVC